MAEADDLLRAVLRRATTAWSGGNPDQFIGSCIEHGAGPLVEQRLREAGRLDRWPTAIRTALHVAALEAAAMVELRERELGIVLPALAAAGVATLVIKGAAVARTHYPDARLRPSGDVDLLVRPAAVDRCTHALAAIGYSAANETAGRFVTYQHHFIGPPRARGLVLDVHWKVNNPQLFADVLTFDEIDAEAVDVPAPVWGRTGVRSGSDPDLTPARCPSAVHSLLHAAVHRVAHRSDTTDLLTVSDIHHIFSALSPEEMQRLASLAAARRVAGIALTGLGQAREWFGTRVPEEIAGQLARDAEAHDEPSAVHLRPMRPVDVLISDLWALDGWRKRTQLIREHVLPPASYMLRAYGVSSRALLPALYAHRLVTGARRWLRAPRG